MPQKNTMPLNQNLFLSLFFHRIQTKTTPQIQIVYGELNKSSNGFDSRT